MHTVFFFSQAAILGGNHRQDAVCRQSEGKFVDYHLQIFVCFGDIYNCKSLSSSSRIQKFF